MKPIKVLLLGAGSRGTHTYAEYAKQNPKMVKVVAIAEPDDVKRSRICETHGIPESSAFKRWEDAFAVKPDADAVIIATQDKMHMGPLLAAMEKGLHILCEKPIVPTLEECREIESKFAGFDKVFLISHVLRYTNFFSRIKALLDAGRIGKLVGIDLNENVGHVHMSHSFVRGNWRKSADSSPMILAKSCHDMDMLLWLAGADCETLSSYGALNYFKEENAPAGAPQRCMDGCPHMATCPYHVQKIYLTDNVAWPVNVITTDLSMEGRIAALEKGNWGRCVFRCDNDVVDHQTVAIRFVNGVSATFTMSAFSMKTHRNIKLMGTEGEIVGDMEDGRIELRHFPSGEQETIAVFQPVGGHSGGDVNLITDFVRLVRDRSGSARTTARESIQSHFMAFASESSRLRLGALINIEEFRRK